MTGLKLGINERLRKSERARRISIVLIGLALFLAVYCGFWWIDKNVSYSLQYEDMVRATVREMVKPEAMKERP